MSRQAPFFRWLAAHMLTVEQFKNVITLMLVLTYCYLALSEVKVSNEFSMMVIMALTFYFKREKSQ
jgi:hypothetical protein